MYCKHVVKLCKCVWQKLKEMNMDFKSDAICKIYFYLNITVYSKTSKRKRWASCVERTIETKVPTHDMMIQTE